MVCIWNKFFRPLINGDFHFLKLILTRSAAQRIKKTKPRGGTKKLDDVLDNHESRQTKEHLLYGINNQFESEIQKLISLRLTINWEPNNRSILTAFHRDPLDRYTIQNTNTRSTRILLRIYRIFPTRKKKSMIEK